MLKFEHFIAPAGPSRLKTSGKQLQALAVRWYVGLQHLYRKKERRKKNDRGCFNPLWDIKNDSAVFEPLFLLLSQVPANHTQLWRWVCSEVQQTYLSTNKGATVFFPWKIHVLIHGKSCGKIAALHPFLMGVLMRVTL